MLEKLSRVSFDKFVKVLIKNCLTLIFQEALPHKKKKDGGFYASHKGKR